MTWQKWLRFGLGFGSGCGWWVGGLEWLEVFEVVLRGFGMKHNFFGGFGLAFLVPSDVE